MELVSSRDEFSLFEKTISEIPFTLSLHPLSYLHSLSLFTLSSLSYLLSPIWPKLPYICNKLFYYNNLNITFLNYRTIEKSPQWPTMAYKVFNGSQNHDFQSITFPNGCKKTL